MNLHDIRAELSIKAFELEQALNAGLPHSELIKIYRQLKEIQYRLILAQVPEEPPGTTQFIIE